MNEADGAETAPPHGADGRGELVTDLLQRRLSRLALPDSSLNDLLSDLSLSNSAAADVVFHVRRSNCTPHQKPPLHSTDEDPGGVFCVLAHSCVLRRESDYFREILQRDADHQKISAGGEKPQDVPDHLLGGCRSSNDIMYGPASASTMDDMREMGIDGAYIFCNIIVQEEHMPASAGTNLSISAATMNDMIASEVLAHVQAQFRERLDDPSARQLSEQDFCSSKSSSVSADGAQLASVPSEQEYCGCKASFVSVDGALLPSEQEYRSCKVSLVLADRVQPSSEQEYHSCKSSFVSANGASDYHPAYITSEDCPSSSSMSIATAQLPASNLSELSLSSPSSDGQPRKSILLNNDNRKVSISGSMRKSVRFSLKQADIILPTSMAENCTPRLDTGGEHSAAAAALEEEAEKGKHLKEESREGKVFTSNYGEANLYKDITNVTEPEIINKPVIKRRHTEVSMVMERGADAVGEQKKNEEDASTYSFKFFLVKKLTWTESVLIGIMEWLYVGMCHVNLEDLSGLYDAAYRAVITSLTWCIRRHSLPEYLHLALLNPLHRKALHDLCLVSDCAELSSLKSFCEALQAINGQPKIAILESKAGPKDVCVWGVLSEGFFVLDGHPLCVLKSCKAIGFESPRLNDAPLSFLTFAKHPPPTCRATALYQNRSIAKCDQSTHEQTWKVVVLDDDPAGSLYIFFKHVAAMLRTRSRSLPKRGKRKSKGRESNQKDFAEEEGRNVGAFKLQMITRFKVGSVLVECLREAIREGIRVREKRGAGAFIKGPSYCTSIVIEGDPWKILMAAKAIPYDMVGRSALKIRDPCVKTFSRLFHASHTFGVDLHSQSIVLVKPLYVLIKVLEFMGNLNTDAYEAPSTERTFIELNQPSEPF